DTGVLAIDAAHQHVDLLVAPRVTGRKFATHVGDHAVCDVPDGQPQCRRTLLVEHNLDFRIAHLDRRPDVRESLRLCHCRDDVPVYRFECEEVIAGYLDLQRVGETH